MSEKNAVKYADQIFNRTVYISSVAKGHYYNNRRSWKRLTPDLQRNVHVLVAALQPATAAVEECRIPYIGEAKRTAQNLYVILYVNGFSGVQQ